MVKLDRCVGSCNTLNVLSNKVCIPNKIKDFNMKFLDPNKIKIDEKLYKNILVYYIAYVTVKGSIYVKINSINPLYIMFNRINGYFEEIKENKYLTLVSTNENKEKIKKYEELWIKINNLIKTITKKSDDYDKKYMKIEFHSDDKLPLNKAIEIPVLVIDVRAIFYENNKYYPQVFIDECLYKTQKCYIMIQLRFLKELTLIKQAHQKSVIFVAIGIC